MKSHFYHTFSAVLLAAVVLGSPAFAKSVKVTLTKTDDTVITGFVVNGNASTLVVASSPTAPNGSHIARSEIANIYWDEPADWKAGWKLWTQRDYAAAGKAFEVLSKTYGNLVNIEDSYGSRAKYYQLDCLRRTGKYAQLMDVYDEVKQVKLSDRYKKQIRLFNYWGHVGKELWEPLKLITNKFELEASSVPSHTVPPTTMGLKKIEANLMIQVAYMRGIATEMLARKEYKAAVAAVDPQIPETKAAAAEAWEQVKNNLIDYSRVFTLTYMSDRGLAKQAMERSMAILKDDPSFEDNYTMQKEAYALASFYKDLFGKGSVPSGFEGMLKEPKLPEEVEEEDEEEE